MSAVSPLLVYSPASTRKLAYFDSEEQLCEELGHDYSGGRDWQPHDRAIDIHGHTYRILYNPDYRFYYIEKASEIWDHSRLLSVALADVRLSKQDSTVLEQRVRDADGSEKHRVIIEHIGALPDSPAGRRFGWAFFALLFAFAALVFYGATRLFGWFVKS